MNCVKLLGQRLSARDFDRQVAEVQIRAANIVLHAYFDNSALRLSMAISGLPGLFTKAVAQASSL